MKWIRHSAAVIVLMGGAVFAGTASAQTPQEMPSACAKADVALPSAVAGWASKTPLDSATDISHLDKTELLEGHAVSLALHPTREVTYPTQPEKPGGSVAHGGLIGVTITSAGTYEVGLGSGAWIDVLKDGAAIVSTAHGHGPSCSTIRKVVDFPLTPGRYVIQISANAEPTLQIMIWRRP